MLSNIWYYHNKKVAEGVEFYFQGTMKEFDQMGILSKSIECEKGFMKHCKEYDKTGKIIKEYMINKQINFM